MLARSKDFIGFEDTAEPKKEHPEGFCRNYARVVRGLMKRDR